MTVCTDPVAVHEWHPVVAETDLVAGGPPLRSMLLGEGIEYWRAPDGTPVVCRDGRAVGVRVRLGFVWATFGDPDHDVFDVPECDEPDRRLLSAGSIMVATSAPRAVENFLDMGHFPYVHTGILGAEPRTEVLEYEATSSSGGVLATRCRFYQPQAAAMAAGGQISEYVYRVPHPYCVMLYKSNPVDPHRMDVIALLNQPMSEDRVRAHNLLCLIDDVSSDASLCRFQQLIFGQDKTILENQWPKRLPLDPGAELSITADNSSVHYRRWLTDKGLRYAVIAAEEAR